MIEIVELNVHCVVLRVSVFRTYSIYRENFQEVLKQLLDMRYAEFERLNTVEKTSYVLSSENWEDIFDASLHLGRRPS